MIALAACPLRDLPDLGVFEGSIASSSCRWAGRSLWKGCSAETASHGVPGTAGFLVGWNGWSGFFRALPWLWGNVGSCRLRPWEMLCITNCCRFQLVRKGIPLLAAHARFKVSLKALVLALLAACMFAEQAWAKGSGPHRKQGIGQEGPNTTRVFFQTCWCDKFPWRVAVSNENGRATPSLARWLLGSLFRLCCQQVLVCNIRLEEIAACLSTV